MALTSTGMTLADLLERFGAIPAARIRYDPPPGTATEQDVVAIEARENRLFELVDGVLVEKAMGYRQSFFTIALASIIREFVVARKLGLVACSDGMMQLFLNLVWISDVSFVLWWWLFGGGS